ncbi:MAG TPA: glycosyltransferase [Gemmatimonadaceae bacterium]|nr:glycosyltransferase [Gemmatimonadaceae bacterium]
MNDLALASLVASPWIFVPLATIWRIRHSRELARDSASVSPGGPLVSVVVPARDERRNIESCVRSILAGGYPNIEVVVVDDRSTDGTADVVRAIARDDERLTLIQNPPLPDGWFGKPWACATGARSARGEIICFTDADARHGRDLVARAVNGMTARRLDMLSVAGRQELGSFWERIVQPHVFWMIASRYGGTETVNRSKRAEDKIANGQCIFVRRSAYVSIGGHEAVRNQVAEDVALAQRLFAAGRRTELILGRDELTTRMYTSLREIMAGWRKNIFAGGREAMPWGRVGQAIFPALLLLSPLLTLLPLVGVVAGALAGGPRWLLLASAIALAAQVITWAAVYRWMGAPMRFAALFPLGSIIVAIIAVQAIARGSRVEWKGRAYLTTSRAPHRSR